MNFVWFSNWYSVSSISLPRVYRLLAPFYCLLFFRPMPRKSSTPIRNTGMNEHVNCICTHWNCRRLL